MIIKAFFALISRWFGAYFSSAFLIVEKNVWWHSRRRLLTAGICWIRGRKRLRPVPKVPSDENWLSEGGARTGPTKTNCLTNIISGSWQRYTKDLAKRTERLEQMSRILMIYNNTTNHENAYLSKTNGGMRFAFQLYGKGLRAVTRSILL